MPKKQILIFEHHPEICHICELILGKEYNVETNSNETNIFNDAADVKPDLIILDYWIIKAYTQIDVKAFIENYRKNGVPVILFSEVNHIEKITMGVNASGYIKKPFDIEELRETVKKYVISKN